MRSMSKPLTMKGTLKALFRIAGSAVMATARLTTAFTKEAVKTTNAAASVLALTALGVPLPEPDRSYGPPPKSQLESIAEDIVSGIENAIREIRNAFRAARGEPEIPKHPIPDWQTEQPYRHDPPEVARAKYEAVQLYLAYRR